MPHFQTISSSGTEINFLTDFFSAIKNLGGEEQYFTIQKDDTITLDDLPSGTLPEEMQTMTAIELYEKALQKSATSKPSIKVNIYTDSSHEEKIGQFIFTRNSNSNAGSSTRGKASSFFLKYIDSEGNSISMPQNTPLSFKSGNSAYTDVAQRSLKIFFIENKIKQSFIITFGAYSSSINNSMYLPIFNFQKKITTMPTATTTIKNFFNSAGYPDSASPFHKLAFNTGTENIEIFKSKVFCTGADYAYEFSVLWDCSNIEAYKFYKIDDTIVFSLSENTLFVLDENPR